MELSQGKPLNTYQIEKRTGLSHATCHKIMQKAYKDNLVKIVKVEKFHTGLETKYYSLTLKGIITAYSLGIPIEQLKKMVIENLKEQEKLRDVELFFNVLDILGREDSLTLLDIIDITNNTPKLKEIPLSLIEKADKLLNVIAQHKPYNMMLKKMLQEYLEKLT